MVSIIVYCDFYQLLQWQALLITVHLRQTYVIFNDFSSIKKFTKIVRKRITLCKYKTDVFLGALYQQEKCATFPIGFSAEVV